MRCRMQEHYGSSFGVSATTQQAHVNRQKREDLFARYYTIWTLAALSLCQLRRLGAYGAPASDQATAAAVHPADHLSTTPAAARGTMTDDRNTGRATTFGVPATTFGVPATTFGVPATTFGVPATTFEVHATTFGDPETTFPTAPTATNAMTTEEDTHPVQFQQLSSNELTPESVSSSLVTDSAYFQATRATIASPTSLSKRKAYVSAQPARYSDKASSAIVLWWTFGALAVVALVVGAAVSLFISRRRVVLGDDPQLNPGSAPAQEIVGGVGCNSDNANQVSAKAESRTAPNTGDSVGIAGGGMGGNNCVPQISTNGGSHSQQSDTHTVVGGVSGRSDGPNGNDHLPLPSAEAGAQAAPGISGSVAVNCGTDSSDRVSQSSVDTGFRDAQGSDGH